MRTRPGKTSRDRWNYVWERNAQNKAERANWQQEVRHKANSKGTGGVPPFPAHTCNGKKNRSLDRFGKPIHADKTN